MPKVPVDEAPASPALDAAVAEALGWEQKGEGAALSWRTPAGKFRTREETSYGSFKPSEDIAAADVLWDTLIEGNHIFSVCPFHDYSARGGTAAQLMYGVFLDAQPDGPGKLIAKAETLCGERNSPWCRGFGTRLDSGGAMVHSR